MIRRILDFLPFLLILLIALLTIFSWIGSVYGMDVQNLMSADGVRWLVSNVLPNFNQAPIAIILLTLMTLSTLTESELLTTLFRRSKPLTLKQRRALLYATVVFFLGIALILALTLLPSSILLSAFGHFEHSALQKGLFSLLLALVLLASVTYGYTAGRFFSWTDLVRAAAYIPSRVASYWLTLFVVSQFVACLDHVFTPSSPTPLTILAYLLYFVPLLLHLVNIRRT